MLCQSGESGEGQVGLFFVETDYRHCGVGSALLKAVLDGVKKLGCTHLMLWPAEPLADAIRLYESLVYNRTNENYGMAS